ncbi:hypothetical protein Hdeb2414_s0014g00428611 [Helianthus debilis subsp. tardiflorus]
MSIMATGRRSSNIPESVENTIWANDKQQHENRSPNGLEFYYAGDCPSCYSSYIGSTPLDKHWWGGLLGFCGNRFIQQTVNCNIFKFYIQKLQYQNIVYSMSENGVTGSCRRREMKIPELPRHQLVLVGRCSCLNFSISL